MESVLVAIVLVAALGASGVFRVLANAIPSGTGFKVRVPSLGRHPGPRSSSTGRLHAHSSKASGLPSPRERPRPRPSERAGASRRDRDPGTKLEVPDGSTGSERAQLRELAARLSRIESALDAGASVNDARFAARPEEIRARLHKLAELGIEKATIARELGLSVAEVELMLKLQKAAVRT